MFFWTCDFLCLGQIRSNHAEIPFLLCGHVYANPSRELYVLVLTISVLTLLDSAISAMKRCTAIWLRGDEEVRTAHLVACVGIHAHNNLCVQYVRQWLVLTNLGFYIIIPGSMLWFLGSQFQPIYIALGFVIALQALNMFLAVVMISIPRGEKSTIHKYIDLLSVFATEKEYVAPDFENKLIPFEEICDATSICIAEITQNAQAVIDLSNGNSLCIRSGRDTGLSTNNCWRIWFSFSPMRIPIGQLVRIQEKDLNFKLIPVRVPYSIMWYSTYKGLEIIGGYSGAEEIDKCLFWLALVSLLTAFLISYIPGPCVVIKTINRQ